MKRHKIKTKFEMNDIEVLFRSYSPRSTSTSEPMPEITVVAAILDIYAPKAIAQVIQQSIIEPRNELKTGQKFGARQLDSTTELGL